MKSLPPLSVRGVAVGGLAALTPAERLVAAQVAQGLSNKEIAVALGKAEPTIKHQVGSILQKTGTVSRCRLIVLLLQPSDHVVAALERGYSLREGCVQSA